MDMPSRGSDRFDKFTERARRVLSYAQEEAQHFNHNYIGTEHLLLGLLRDTDGIAARVLQNLGVSLEKVRRAVEVIIGRGDRLVLGEIGLTPRAKKVMELAVDEARRLNHHYIGTEHLLLGLLREGEGIAAGVLRSLGLNLENVRTQVVRITMSIGEIAAASGASAASGQTAPGEPAGPAAPSWLRERRTSGQWQTVAGEPAGPTPGGVKNNVVTCRLDDAAVDALDALVEAGVRSTRSDAAAWLIAAGIESHRALFERVNATVREIRRLRAEAQTLAEQVIREAEGPEQAEGAPPDTPSEHPEGDDGPDVPGSPE